MPTDEIGAQKEWDAKRAVLITRNLQASEGILQEPSSHPRPGDKRPASPPRDSPTTQQRERERERERERVESHRELETATLAKEKGPARKARG